MQKLLAVLMIALLQVAAGFGVQQHALRVSAARPQVGAVGRFAAMPRMQEGEEKPVEADAAAPAEAPPTPVPPPPAPEAKGFDITNYSLTITLLAVFAGAKALGALGVIDVN